VRSTVMSVSLCLCVCLSVCLSVHSHNSKTTRPNFTKFFVFVACGRGSVLPWWRYDTLFSNRVANEPESSRVSFKISSPGGGTRWTLDDYSVWFSSSECDTAIQYNTILVYCWGELVCYLRLPYHSLLGRGSKVLMATGFVYGYHWFSTPTNSTSFDQLPKRCHGWLRRR